MTNNFIVPIEGIKEILTSLLSQGILLGLCSNNNEFWYRRQMLRCDLHRFFAPSRVRLSCRVGVSKSSPKFEMFHAAVDAVGVPPSHCLFIDDRQSNVDRARECGWEAMKFEDVNQLKEGLKARMLWPV